MTQLLGRMGEWGGQTRDFGSFETNRTVELAACFDAMIIASGEMTQVLCVGVGELGGLALTAHIARMRD